MKAGIDIGSRSIKIYFEINGNPIRKKIDTISFFKNYLSSDNDMLKIENNDLFNGYHPDEIIATGYGKLATNIKTTKTISEIIAHAVGAMESTGEKNFILVDIGGQDTKVIKISDCNVVDFQMNNKCAAGSGRYIENMAQILGLSISDISSRVKNPIRIDSTCTTFGESEVLGKFFEDNSIENIAAGINEAVARRLIPMIRKYNSNTIFVSGGVANNSAVISFLSTGLSLDVKRIDFPDFNGAYGCYKYE
jgi:predicted CoA-substrate-specific enzyme activase